MWAACERTVTATNPPALKAEIEALSERGVRCSEVDEARWGSVTSIRLPGGGDVGLYQPKTQRHLSAPQADPWRSSRLRRRVSALEGPVPRLWHSRDDAHDHSAVGTLRTPDRPRWIGRAQSAPLVFLEEATQLAALGFEAAGLALAHLMRLTPAAAAGAAGAAAPRRGAVERRVGAPSE
jgi:hypothetical protein